MFGIGPSASLIVIILGVLLIILPVSHGASPTQRSWDRISVATVILSIILFPSSLLAVFGYLILYRLRQRRIAAKWRAWYRYLHTGQWYPVPTLADHPAHASDPGAPLNDAPMAVPPSAAEGMYAPLNPFPNPSPKPAPNQPSPRCTQCGTAMAAIPEYRDWYCFQCDRYRSESEASVEE